jgi:hypothetical protein
VLEDVGHEHRIESPRLGRGSTIEVGGQVRAEPALARGLDAVGVGIDADARPIEMTQIPTHAAADIEHKSEV